MSLPLAPDLVTFMESGLSLMIGTRGPDYMPETVRGVGIRVWPDRLGVTVFVPAANGARTVANLRDNGRIAITESLPQTHETLQLKGTVTGIRDAAEPERDLVDAYLAAFSDVVGYCGMSKNITLRLVNWPAVAIDVAITELYTQTPGPDAGQPMSPSAARPSRAS